MKPAAKQQGPEAAAASPPDAAADPSHQPAPQDSRQGELYNQCRVPVWQLQHHLGNVADISLCTSIKMSIQVHVGWVFMPGLGGSMLVMIHRLILDDYEQRQPNASRPKQCYKTLLVISSEFFQ